MGTVYLAERADGAFSDVWRPCVKVVPLALASVDIEERFRRERQFLASLDHPNIARLIDGGITDTRTSLPGDGIRRRAAARPVLRLIASWIPAHARIVLMRQVLEALIYRTRSAGDPSRPEVLKHYGGHGRKTRSCSISARLG